ncbi:MULTISPECIES: type IV pilus modification protein PilV [unclassified Pseudomonas]|uniref:type IV pilus modification protein PilV n=1 Tax=unclassified Pseudomonas TaxID=196821 RepID=UPI000D3C4D92|nr:MULTISPECIES: type IV pilus modification protein PilV [unclassified Pseudomonas]RAU44904.1 type IV pilus modification protein PilV [Pseudomonas sp. RIT 409]RAU53525.1 type IV pilus modification protein PilV [Pseudomonas sp. RIT 412]
MNLASFRNSAGFSMIEVLVSLIVIAVGVLGMVALQSKAIPYTQDSVQRNAAIMLVDDLVEIIRAAPADCTTANGCLTPPGTNFPAVPSSCVPTPAALADQIGCWTARARAVLPGVTNALLASAFYICKSASPGVTTSCTTSSTTNAELEIQVAWTVKSAADCMTGSTSTLEGTCTYRLRTRIR